MILVYPRNFLQNTNNFDLLLSDFTKNFIFTTNFAKEIEKEFINYNFMIKLNKTQCIIEFENNLNIEQINIIDNIVSSIRNQFSF